MFNRILKNVAIVSLLISLPLTASAQKTKTDETLWRYAIVIGVNDGGDARAKLRYAQTDAKEFAAVLRSFGGVETRDLMLLLEPDRFSIESAFANMRSLLKNTKQSGTRQEVLIYYSGHSDEKGLLLGDDDYPYREFRAALSELPADVRIAILDSCSSGALSRTKGGSRRAPFLMDSSVNVHGHAFMTSASADEAAQESDKIGGSFFTHYLTTGLRGAADADKDRRVSLNEAYNYAFQETLARTESTMAGPQHANYDFQLKGSGDLVLTDLRGSSALLEISNDINGNLYIRNDNGRLIAEINKENADSLQMGLDPGRYTITLENEKGLFKGTAQVERGQKTLIRQSELNESTKELAVARGDIETNPDDAQPGPASEQTVTLRPVQFGLLPGGISLLPLNRPEGPKRTFFALNFIGDGHYLYGMEAGILGNIRYYDVSGLQAAGLFNFNKATTCGLQASGLFNHSGNLRGLQAAGLFNINRGEYVQGLQGSGLFNINSGRLRGLQTSGLFNINRDKLYGLQSAGLFNVAGEFRGIRTAGLFNYTQGPSQGMHAAGLFNFVNGPTRGFTASGVANINTSSSHGFLGAGLVNFNRSASMGFMGAGLVNINGGAYHGFQGAGLVNISAKDDSNGWQSAGIANYGNRVRGFQGAGLLNVARESMTGLQASLVNIGGDVKGAQVGLVNIATEDLKGAQIGLVNIGGGVYFAPSFWISGGSLLNMGLKFGGRYTYAILGYGIHPQKDEKRSSFFYGFGGHVDFDRFWLDIDILSHQLMADYTWNDDMEDYLFQLRPHLGYRLLDQLSVYAGPSLNLLVSQIRKDAELIPGFWSHRASDDTNVRMSIDFLVGFQWEPRFRELNNIRPSSRKSDAAAQAPELQQSE